MNKPKKSPPGRPETTIDWIAFGFLLLGALSWGYFVTDVNILDKTLEPVADILDDIVFVLIALSGLWWLYRVLQGPRSNTTEG